MFIRILFTCLWVFSASHALSENETYAGSSDEGANLRPVGSVSLVIGRAFSKSLANAEFARLNSGALLYEGDTLKTESSGHIHLQLRDSDRFLDGPILRHTLITDVSVATVRGTPALSPFPSNLRAALLSFAIGSTVNHTRELRQLMNPLG